MEEITRIFSLKYKKSVVSSAYKYSFFTKAVTEDELQAESNKPETDKKGREITIMSVVNLMHKSFTKVQIEVLKLKGEVAGSTHASPLKQGKANVVKPVENAVTTINTETPKGKQSFLQYVATTVDKAIDKIID